MAKDNTTGEVLQDLKKGKEKPWREKKIKSIRLEQSFLRLTWFGRAERVGVCGSSLLFLECSKDGHKKLARANFCRDRMCPMCNWRRSLMLHGQILKILHRAVETKPKMRFIFLTLTAKNAPKEGLDELVSQLYKGFDAMRRLKDFDKAVKGYVRVMEVTYNDKTKEYHPHFHVLIAVNSSYFGDGYISHARWVDMWARSLRVDYLPSVRVSVVKPKKEGQTVEAAVAETAKYSVKDSDYLFDDEKKTDEVVETLALVLKGRRLIGFGKLFYKLKSELGIKDIESEKADLVGEKESCKEPCPICSSTLIEQLYEWNLNIRNYIGSDI